MQQQRHYSRDCRVTRIISGQTIALDRASACRSVTDPCTDHVHKKHEAHSEIGRASVAVMFVLSRRTSHGTANISNAQPGTSLPNTRQINKRTRLANSRLARIK